MWQPLCWASLIAQLVKNACKEGAAAAAKSLQSCPTLCDPIDGSPPGSPIPGILQARILEWLPFPSPIHESESEVAWSCPTLRARFNSWVGKIPWRRDRLLTPLFLGFPCGSTGKESACTAGDLGSIPGLGRTPGERKGYPLQYSGLENSMDCPWGPKESIRLSDFFFLSFSMKRGFIGGNTTIQFIDYQWLKITK